MKAMVFVGYFLYWLSLLGNQAISLGDLWSRCTHPVTLRIVGPRPLSRFARPIVSIGLSDPRSSVFIFTFRFPLPDTGSVQPQTTTTTSCIAEGIPDSGGLTRANVAFVETRGIPRW